VVHQEWLSEEEEQMWLQETVIGYEIVAWVELVVVAVTEAGGVEAAAASSCSVAVDQL
jgi:hypothetical protein